MSEHLPTVSGKEFIRLLLKRGWREIRQRGSHIIVQKDGEHRALSIPNHREISAGTLRSLLKQAGISLEEFRNWL
ncbi:MAG: type II toxin-antitoxin system HicA family toxin [Candidatus Kapabacteria bacterium]|jgi:predicted RNA binding protein YcfA (HicA-like mRNA interferase family)|nr:type II toxin-antitoxin system HicA family toxin [Candidatus Kapabacteria bacterium]